MLAQEFTIMANNGKFNLQMLKIFKIILTLNNFKQLLQFIESENDLVKAILEAQIEFSSDSKCINNKCKSEIHALEIEHDKLQAEIRNGQIKYHEILISNLKKDFEIRSLKEKLKDNRFHEFSKMLSSETIDELKSINSAENKDSNFVLKVVRDLYKNDLLKLKNKSYSGQRTKKQPMTPEKVNIIKTVFSKRVQTLENGEERNKNLSKLIKSAIETINNVNNKQ